MINWRRVKFRRAVVWAVENAVWIYMLYAAIWSLCYVSDWIFVKWGVG